MKRQELIAILGVSDANWLLQSLYSEILNDNDFDDAILAPLIARALAGEPMARITGCEEFYGRNFFLNEATLIPRPDSESLIEAALPLSPQTILDLGTGSGILLITLIGELPNSKGLGIDISKKALEVAQKNARYHHSNASFQQSDWFSKVEGRFDLIISNPPYISRSETLASSVLDHDPHLALFAENNGLACYELIFAEAKNYLNPQGHVIVEIGYQQFESVTQIAKNNGFSLLSSKKDLGGHIRALTFKINEPN